ncbi:hypothetical protein ACLOJK_014809 [Asimina triloba]
MQIRWSKLRSELDITPKSAWTARWASGHHPSDPNNLPRSSASSTNPAPHVHGVLQAEPNKPGRFHRQQADIQIGEQGNESSSEDRCPFGQQATFIRDIVGHERSASVPHQQISHPPSHGNVLHSIQWPDPVAHRIRSRRIPFKQQHHVHRTA